MAKAGLGLVATTPASEDTLADAIKKISDGVTKLTASGLNRDAIVVLLKDDTGVPKKQINLILDGLKDLATKYTGK